MTLLHALLSRIRWDATFVQGRFVPTHHDRAEAVRRTAS